MLFADASYDLETQKALCQVFERAWAHLLALNVSSRDADEIRQRLEVRIMKAAATGERDPDRLRDAVLEV